MARSSYARRSGGFTILEVLFVIGIISILASIILAVRSQVRDKANLVLCQTNMRNLYLAQVNYANANDGWLAAPSSCGETATSTYGAQTCWAEVGYGIADLKVGTLWPYLPVSADDRVRAILCPSDVNEDISKGGMAMSNRNYSYSFNVNIRPNYGSGVVTIKLPSVAQPARRGMIYEEFGPNDALCCGPGDADDWLTGRHGGPLSTQVVYNDRSAYASEEWQKIGQGNVCYFDGHVALMSVATYFNDTSHFSPLNN